MFCKDILDSDMDVIEYLVKEDIDNFLKTFHKLKEKLGYKSIGNFLQGKVQIQNILEISKILGYSKAIDYLAEYRCKVNKRNVTLLDIDTIMYASDKLLKSDLESFTPCLYKGHPVKFIEYFKGLSVEDKKVAIKSILNCNEVSNDHGVIEWFDKEYPELIREVGLGLI